MAVDVLLRRHAVGMRWVSGGGRQDKRKRGAKTGNVSRFALASERVDVCYLWLSWSDRAKRALGMSATRRSALGFVALLAALSTLCTW
jgi:hypothetical protein